MDAAAFEAALRRDGFTEIETKTVEAKPPSQPHAHPYDVRALVLDGEITLTSEGAARVYRAGDSFNMAAGCVHAENYGPNLTYIFGRRHPA
ncbi:MAG TPA: cupin domain-containing protein [Vineibacter sp.]|nr:cupin domain-containing protein [Vineibacter sp.]